MNANFTSYTEQASKGNLVLHALFLFPLLLFFILNPVQTDIVTHNITLDFFWLIYLSLMAALTIFVGALLTGQARFDGVLILFSLLFLVTLISTLVFQTFPEQGILKKTAQLCMIAIACVSAYLTGKNFSFHPVLIRGVTLLIGVGISIQLLLISKNNYFYYLRPYGWSNYMLPFFLYWVATIEKNTHVLIRAVFCAVIVFAIVVSGTRTLLLWSAFGLLVTKPAQIPMRMLIAAILGGLFFLIYGSVASNEGALALVARYQDLLADNRSALWMQAMELFKSLNIFLGGGYFSYTTYKLFDEEISSAHNTYLTLLLQSGLLGLLLGVSLLFVIIKCYWRVVPGIVLFLPLVGVIGELPLYPYTYSRIFENMVMYFLIGILAASVGKEKTPASVENVKPPSLPKFNYA